MSKIHGSTIGIVLLAATTALSSNVATQTKIMPLGDSITQSRTGLASYRYYLDQLLTNGGYSFDFVGSATGVRGGPPLFPNFDQDHEGHDTLSVDRVLPNLPGWAQAALPDIVLVHLGTNDIISQESSSSTANELGQVIDVLRSANPNVTVLLAQIIPMATRNVTYVNNLIPGVVASKDTPESRVAVVDHFTGYDVGIHLGPDGVHPNDNGEQRMAQTWFDTLIHFMTPAQDVFSEVGMGCSGNALATPDLAPIRGQAASLGNPYTIRFESVPAGSSPVGILGFSVTDYYGLPLPIDLSVIGATGCALWTGPDVTFPLVPVGTTASWTLSIPNEPILVGNRFYEQGAFLAAGLNDLGIVFSEAGATTVVE